MPSLLSAIDASASGLDAQRTRLEVAISNITNAESTSTVNGRLEPYRRREVVLETKPFEATLDGTASTATGVRVAAVVEDQSAFQKVHNPGHPNADEDGNVLLPNVEVPEEMVDMISASRAYQANLTAIGLIRDTIQRALDLAK